MPHAPFDPPSIRRGFDRAARGYARHAALQQEVEARLLDLLDYVKTPPARILDVGCGPGTAARALKKRWPKAQVVALDGSLAMADQARRAAGRWRPDYAVVCADAAALPFAGGSFDLIFSNLALPWITDLPALFAQWRAVLNPGGFVACSSLGPETLEELREAFAEDPAPHVHAFAPMQHLGDALLAAGFRNPVLDADRFTLTHPTLDALMADLRGAGGGNAMAERRRSLTGRGRIEAARAAYEAFRTADGLLPSTWEVVYAHAFAPEHGQPVRQAGHDLVSVPLSRIPIRRRS
ncbi:MAG: malonyl-ACP O-methyltransferase BioC [Lysobacteraceae bacterium]